MRSAFVVVLSLLFIYVGFSAYTELRLIRLLRSTRSEDAVKDTKTYQGHIFASQLDMEIFINQQRRNKLSPWTEPLEEWAVLLLLASSASFLGSAVRYIKDSLDKRKRPVVTQCLFGLAVGPCLMAIAWIPELLILEGELRFRPERLAAFCFLAGIFAPEAWNYVTKSARKLFGE